MGAWPAWAQNFVRAIVGNAAGPINASNPLDVQGTVTAGWPAGTALADAFANPTAPATAVFPSWFNGTTWDRARGTIASGLAVDPTGHTARVSQTPTVSTSPAYTANDCVGGLLTYAGMARVSGAGGTLTDVIVVDKGNQKAPCYLVLFNQTFTAGTDNAAWNPTESDFDNVVAVIPIAAGDYVTQGSASLAVAHIKNLAVAYLCNVTSLYGQLWTTGTPTYTATTDIEVILKSKTD